MSPRPSGGRGRGAVVVGNGAAAVHAVRGLRGAGYDGAVHVLSDGGETPYSPMLLGYYIGGGLSRERCFPFGPGEVLHRELGLTFHGGDAVRRVEAHERVAVTESGDVYPFDACVVAGGAVPVELSAPGADGARVHRLRTLAQADRLQSALTGARRVLVVGASLVGMKVVEALVLRGIAVVLVDVAPQVLPGAAHPDCAGLVERGLAARGVRLHLGTEVRAFEESPAGLRVWLAAARSEAKDATGPEAATVGAGADGVPADRPLAVDVDLAVVAVGVRPNVDLVDPGEVAVDRGLLVDEHCATTVPGIYGAGDCTQMWNRLTGRHEVIGLWASACYQGRAAGRNAARFMAAGGRGGGRVGRSAEGWGGGSAGEWCDRPDEAAPAAFATHVIHFLDWVLVSIGDPRAGSGATDALEACDPDRGVYYRLAIEDGRVVGANLLNCCDGAGLLRHSGLRARLGRDPTTPPPMGWPRFVQEVCGVQAAATALGAVGRGEGGM